MQNIANDADDFGLFVAKDIDVFPQWILAGPNDFREFLVDDDDWTGSGDVGSGEFTATTQRNAHGAEVSWIESVNADERLVAALEGWTSCGGAHARSGVITFERKIVGDGNAFNTWKRSDTGEELIEKLSGTALFGVADAGEVHPHGHDVIGIETGLDLKETEEAAG